MDSLYRGYPSGAILVWESDEPVPTRDFAVSQSFNPYHTTKLLLDGQQRLTSLSAVLHGKPIKVRWRQRPIDLLFNLEHPERPSFVSEVDERASEPDDDDVVDASDDELAQRLEQLTFVAATNKLERLPHWIRVSDVFQADSDAAFFEKAGVTGFKDPRYEKYNQRLKRLRNIRKYTYRMDILERGMSYEEVTEIFVRVNSLGAKLRSSDLAMAQIYGQVERIAQDVRGISRGVCESRFRDGPRNSSEDTSGIRNWTVSLQDGRKYRSPKVTCCLGIGKGRTSIRNQLLEKQHEN